ncbi:hypothetical protein N8867_01780 [Flavobacteriaceae bacterium]|nr:hypothetical protein [Flavobacteriaceae bacterium]
MKKILLLISLIAVSCSSNPEYDSNLELAKNGFKLSKLVISSYGKR